MKIAKLLAIALVGLVVANNHKSNGATWTAVKALNPNAGIESRNDDYTPSIATDDNQNWLAFWGSNQPPGLEYDAYSATSIDNGLSWFGPVAVNSDAGTISNGQDITEDLATDGHGTWVGVWMKNNGLGTGADSDIFYSRSTNIGINWSNLATINSDATTDTFLDQYPYIASDGKGTFVTVWGSIITPSYDYYMRSSRSTDNGLTWEPTQFVYPAPLYKTSGPNTQFKVATDTNGVWMAVAHSTQATSSTTGTDFDIIAFRSVDNGATWGAPIVVDSGATSDTLGEGYPWIACDGRNTWIATWSSAIQGGGFAVKVARSTDGGLTWSTPQSVSSNLNPYDTQPVVESDRHSGWILAWESKISSDFDIQYIESKDNGLTWSNAGYLNSNAASDNSNDNRVKIASNHKGRWIAVWTSKNSVPTNGGPDAEVNYSITDFGYPNASTSSSTLDFGSIQTDGASSKTLDLIIKSVGTAAVNFGPNNFSIDGPSSANFAVTNNPSSAPLYPDDSRTVSIRFTPEVTGANLAVLKVISDSPNSPDFIYLQGYGTNGPAMVEDWSIY